MAVGGHPLPREPGAVRLRPVPGVEFVPGGQAAGAQEVVVAERLADAEIGEDGRRDPPVQGLQGGGGADRDQQVRAVQHLAHVPVDQAAVGGQAARQPGHQLLVRQFLDVRGVLAGLAAQLDQHLAVRVQPRVPGGPAQQVVAARAVVRYGGLDGEAHGVGALPRGRLPVGLAAEERQGRLDDAPRTGAHTGVDGAETFRVVPGVGEDHIGAVPQQQTVGQLLVDDTHIAGDHDGAPAGRLPHGAAVRRTAGRPATVRPATVRRTAGRGAGQTVQHRLDGAADARQDDHVVRLAGDRAEEPGGGHLAERVRADSHLVELTGGRRGSSAQEKTVEPVFRRDAVRGERAPFPSRIGIGEYGDPRTMTGTGWHIENARKPFRFPAQRHLNKGLTRSRRKANRPAHKSS